jgi:hypothetical protein
MSVLAHGCSLLRPRQRDLVQLLGRHGQRAYAALGRSRRRLRRQDVHARTSGLALLHGGLAGIVAGVSLPLPTLGAGRHSRAAMAPVEAAAFVPPWIS